MQPGSRLGSYEIVSALGAGGMGEVFRARDSKLGRDVALKILPGTFASDPDRVARFQREAQLLASLNHPHIAAIYGIEEAAATTFLVLELVEGETLDAKLRGLGAGGLGLDEALAIARQIADALEAAHEKGIIHRDLKPANIALTHDGQVKVLDFGLAKALETSPRPELSHSPTLTFAATMAGVILGTAAYMSPEQAKGRAADKRSDVWSFGCVLFEMLTGKRAFDGEDVTDVIAAVVRGEPDWNALAPSIPDHIRLLIKRCLEKDRKQRISDISVAKFLLNETMVMKPPVPVAAPVATDLTRRTGLVPMAIGLAAGAAVTAGIVALRPSPPPAARPARFELVLSGTAPMTIATADDNIALSGDGSQLVYHSGTVGVVAAGSVGGQLGVRALDQLDARLLTGMTDARAPFLSPDGRWIGFFGTGDLRKISVTGGPSITLCRTTGAPRGASWGPNDTIIFATNDLEKGLMSVPAGGGDPKVLTTADHAHGEADHVSPFVLPNGRGVLFTIIGAQRENDQVAVLDFKTGERKTLLRGASHVQYVDDRDGLASSGFLVYATAGTLRAVRFDARRLEVSSDPVPVVDQVLPSTSGAANFALSRSGALAYIRGTAVTTVLSPRTLVWVDRKGNEEPIAAPPRSYATARLSPDGARIALGVYDQNADIWIWELARQTLGRLTFDPGADLSPVWTPDGRKVIWASTRSSGFPNVYWRAADGTGNVERLTTSPNPQFPTSISADGKRLVLFENTSSAQDLTVLSMGERDTAPLLHTPSAEMNADLSPDGHWLAYQSSESGRFEVYVRPFPNVDNGRWQVSTNGGSRPVWSRNGKELFYLDGSDLLTAVPIATGTIFQEGNPTKILSTKYFPGATSLGLDLRGYDVSPDGQRFLMIKETPAERSSTATPSVIVVLNWIEELKSRLPAK
jgi:serine/threonine-protein kinase